MSSKLFREEAIPLITYDQENQKYIINNEAIEIIQQIPQPIGVVGVAGMYRTGKSYLMNRMLLNRSDGFGVGPTVNPCTKGLWIWGKPLLGQTVDGQNCSILVIDSEGLGALDEDSTHDTRIFSLIILLSSCFIYNSVGSIDENAVQNLSLVVNLTKNIQIKASQQQTENEDFSQYFPSFFWVVRDFTLQLVDQEGEVISSKEYLERALTIQKGFSDQVESKNRVRRLLQAFFKERDCITLVRPLTKEENLQNLEKLDFDQLRPEFFEQVISLRKKILNKIKPKVMNGKNLSGQMYCDLIRSYVSAINQGAVPTIESAWIYICRNECQKALGEAMDNYEQVLKELLHNRFPLSVEDLKGYSKVAKESAVVIYKKRCVGDVGEEYLRELSRRMRTRFQLIKQENDREGSRGCNSFIQNEFLAIDRKLKMGEYKTFLDYEKDVRLFYSYFMENGPKGENRQTIILEFLQKALIEGGHHIFRQTSQDSETLRSFAVETQKKLEQDLKESKADGLRDKNNFSMKLNQLETEKSEFQMREQVLQENLENVKQEQDLIDADMQSNLYKDKYELQRQLYDMKEKMVSMEESNKDLERNTLFGKSEFQKEKALLNQRLVFIENQLHESSDKEKTLISELKTQKQFHINQQKEIQGKLDVTTRQLHQKVNDMQEKLNELETELYDKDQKYENEIKRFITKEQSVSTMNTELTEQMQSLQREIRELKRNEENWPEQRKTDASEVTQHLAQQLEVVQDSLKYKEEQLKQCRNQSEKDKALMQQKMEFMEVQLNESRQQLDENRKAHEAIMKAFENSSLDTTYKSDNGKLKDIRDTHKRETKQLETDQEIQRKKFQQQIDQLTEKNNELELKVKFETCDLLKEVDQLKDSLQEVESHRSRLLEQNKALDGSKLSLLKDQEQRYLKRIQCLELQVEDVDQKTAREVQAAQSKAEESLAQLKNFYEIERERLERRISEEKDKNDKKYQSATDEYYQKQKEQESQYEEEIETLKDDLREQESTFQSMIQQYEHELALKQQTLETLEKYIKDTKESLLSAQNANNSTLEQQMNAFAVERKGFISKIETQSIQLNALQKEHMALQQRRDLLESEKQRKETQLEQSRKEWTDERRELSDKMEEAKSKLQTLNDEYLEKKIEYGREMALIQQQNEFLQKKIEDLQKQIDTQCSRYEEKIKQQKAESQVEMNERMERAVEERQVLEQKYDKTKKALKEAEANSGRQLSSLEREKAIIMEKLTNVEYKKNELEQKLKEECSGSSQLNQNLKDQLSQEKKQLSSEIERYKHLNLALEQEKNEVLTSYERDRALWDGKFQFLEQQKEQAKQDLVDALKKFEMTLMHLQRARNNEKDEQESNLNELLLSVERKYQSQIDEANQTHQRVVQDYEDKIRRLSKEMKQHKDQLLFDQHGKLGNQLMSEKKFADMLDNEKKLQHEIDFIKADRDAKVIEYQRYYENERENLKQKISELEIKYKDVENKRSSQIFEFEKERAKWNLDRDHLVNFKSDLSDQLEKLEKKKDSLLRENEKLKNEQRATRRSVNTVHNMTSHTLLTANKYKAGTVNNVSTIGLSRNQISPTHSNNTSMSSANHSVIALKKKDQLIVQQLTSNLTDITNFSQTVDKPSKFNQPTFYVLGDEPSAKYQSFYENKEDTSPTPLDKNKSNEQFQHYKY